VRKKTALIVAGIAALVLFVAVSYWLLAFTVLGVVGYFVMLKRESLKQTGGWLFVGLSAALIALFFLGYLRPTRAINSCLNRPTEWFLQWTSPPKPGGDATADTTFESDFRKVVFENINRAKLTLETDHIVDETSRFVEQTRSDALVPEVIDLQAKLGELRGFLNSNASRAVGLDDPERLRRGQAALQNQLQGFARSVKSAGTPAAQRQLDDELHAVIRKSPFIDLALRLSTIQTLKRKLANADVTATVRPRITFDGDNVVYEEAITLTAARGELVWIDAEPLKKESDLGQFRSEIELEQGGKRTQSPESSRVDVTPGLRTATLITRRIGTVDRTCTTGLGGGIHRLELRWPSPYVVRLATVIKTPDYGESHASVELDRNAQIDEVQIPLWSYLASKDQVEVIPRGDHSVIKYTKGKLIQSDMTADPFWIEVLGPSLVVRNFLVYRLREYLVVENALIAVAVLLIGAAWGKAIN